MIYSIYNIHYTSIHYFPEKHLITFIYVTDDISTFKVLHYSGSTARRVNLKLVVPRAPFQTVRIWRVQRSASHAQEVTIAALPDLIAARVVANVRRDITAVVELKNKTQKANVQLTMRTATEDVQLDIIARLAKRNFVHLELTAIMQVQVYRVIAYHA